MSADGSIEIVWGDGPHTFRFGIGQFRELQEKVNVRRLAIGAPTIGPMALCRALQANDVWPDDLRDILRIGLSGGGMPASECHRAMTNYFDATPPLHHVPAARTVLMAGLVGVPDDPVGSKKKSGPETTMTEKDPSDSPSSMERARQ